MTGFKRVLVIYTGGTFGMLKNEKGVLVPQKNIEAVIRRLPQLHDQRYYERHLAGSERSHYLALPDGKDTDMKILYKIHEYEELKDSSDFTIDDWIKQAQDIKRFHAAFDGFVVLHGTDTTAYGAALLSFMLERLAKSVVLTGAQVPVFQPRSDGVNNLLCALLVAATRRLPEVTVFFGAKLFRGTRVKKVSNSRIYGFDSPNYPPLLEARTTLELDPRALGYEPAADAAEPAAAADACLVRAAASARVLLLKVTPTLEPALLRAVADHYDGIVLETYGNGNMQIKRREVYAELRRAVQRGVLVANVTQCAHGAVLGRAIYETGLLLLECGVVPAFDMTPEAAWAKLAYLLARDDLSHLQRIELMKTSLRGELHNPAHA